MWAISSPLKCLVLKTITHHIREPVSATQPRTCTYTVHTQSIGLGGHAKLPIPKQLPQTEQPLHAMVDQEEGDFDCKSSSQLNKRTSLLQDWLNTKASPLATSPLPCARETWRVYKSRISEAQRRNMKASCQNKASRKLHLGNHTLSHFLWYLPVSVISILTSRNMFEHVLFSVHVDALQYLILLDYMYITYMVVLVDYIILTCAYVHVHVHKMKL